MYGLTAEQRKMYQQSWLESLASLFGLLISVDEELAGKRDQLLLDGEKIWISIMRSRTQHTRGDYITMGTFSHWVAENCGFQVRNDDLPHLIRGFDRNHDGVITKEEFLKAVSAVGDDEEEGDQ